MINNTLSKVLQSRQVSVTNVEVATKAYGIIHNMSEIDSLKVVIHTHARYYQHVIIQHTTVILNCLWIEILKRF